MFFKLLRFTLFGFICLINAIAFQNCSKYTTNASRGPGGNNNNLANPPVEVTQPVDVTPVTPITSPVTNNNSAISFAFPKNFTVPGLNAEFCNNRFSIDTKIADIPTQGAGTVAYARLSSDGQLYCEAIFSNGYKEVKPPHWCASGTVPFTFKEQMCLAKADPRNGYRPTEQKYISKLPNVNEPILNVNDKVHIVNNGPVFLRQCADGTKYLEAYENTNNGVPKNPVLVSNSMSAAQFNQSPYVKGQGGFKPASWMTGSDAFFDDRNGFVLQEGLKLWSGNNHPCL